MYKPVFFFTGLLMLFSFSSCFMGEEKIEIRDNNTGTYTLSVDMGELLKLGKQMGQAGKMQEGMDQKKDTIIYFNPFLDTARFLSVKEKEMLKDGSMHYKVDAANDELMIVMNASFSSLGDIDYTRQHFNKAISKLGVMDVLDPKKKDKKENEKEELESEEQSGSNPITKGYTFTATNGKISYKVTDTRIMDDIMQNDSAVMTMRMLAQMMEGSNLSYSYTLPRPVKNYKGNNAVLSTDKKTIRFTTTLKELLDDPKLLEYEIEY